MSLNILFVCGIPAAGKSSFSRFLRDKHGYFHIDMEESPWSDEEMHKVWDLIFQYPEDENRVKNFVNALQKKKEKVVLDLGFPIGENYFSIIPMLKKSNCRIVWFQCDEKTAKQRYVNRDNRSLQSFEIQIKNIKENWERILTGISPEIVNVLKDSGQEKTFEELKLEIGI